MLLLRLIGAEMGIRKLREEERETWAPKGLLYSVHDPAPLIECQANGMVLIVLTMVSRTIIAIPQ